MSRFDDCLKFVLQQEGGYVKDSDDPGGATNKGITQATYDSYRTRRGFGRQPVVGISGDEIADIYRTQYWKPIRGDSLPRRIDLVVFDAAVNVGIVQASKFLQRALGVEDDGIVGPRTVDAAIYDEMCGMTSHVVADMLDQRRDFYNNLVVKKPTLLKYRKGWLNRVDALAKLTFEGDTK